MKLALISLLLVNILFASERSGYTEYESRRVRYVNFKPNLERTLILKDVIIETNINDVNQRFKDLVAKSLDPIYLILDSPGGSVDAGMRLINTIRAAHKDFGVRTICIVENRAFSMAAVISTFCTRTYMLPTSLMLYHEASYGLQGPATLNLSRVVAFTIQINALNNMIADALRMDHQLYYDLMVKELWLNARDACAHGVADGILDSVYYTAQPTKVSIFDTLFSEEHSTLWNEDYAK